MFKVGCFNFAAVNVEIDGRFEKFLRTGKKVGSKIVDVKNPNAEKLLPFLRLRMQNRCVTAMRVDNDEILYAMLFMQNRRSSITARIVVVRSVMVPAKSRCSKLLP